LRPIVGEYTPVPARQSFSTLGEVNSGQANFGGFNIVLDASIFNEHVNAKYRFQTGTQSEEKPLDEEKISVHQNVRGETVYVYINEFKGAKYLHIREWYKTKEGEEKPGKSGVALPLDKAEALRDGLNQVIAQIKAAEAE
jgi:hypothetical protein